jgi:hypothetical protein
LGIFWGFLLALISIYILTEKSPKLFFKKMFFSKKNYRHKMKFIFSVPDHKNFYGKALN